MKFRLLLVLILSCLHSKAQDCSSESFDYNGYCYDYHSNGQIAWVKEFKEGLAIGIWMKFDDKGNLLLQLNTRYKQDSLGQMYILNESFETPLEEKETQKKVKFIDCVYSIEPMAEFPGGPKSMQEYITKNVIYPEKSLEFGDYGTVYLSFIVEVDGQITNIKVDKGVSEDLDAEAVRLLTIMPKWIPEKLNGKKVQSRGRLPIKFALTVEDSVDEIDSELKRLQKSGVVSCGDEPQYFGGPDSLQAFITKNFQYPETAKEFDCRGTVVLKFIVEADGCVTNIEVVSGIPGCEELEREAVRLVKTMKNWIAPKINGKANRAEASFPIKFSPSN